MRVGLVCPYSFDVPGGVQYHIRDLAEQLIARGVQVSVLAPSGAKTHPDWLVPAGAAIPIPYNGSVARLSLGPIVTARTRRWLEEGRFDVLHIHEPNAPSISLLALALVRPDVAVVCTFHTAMRRSRARELTSPVVRPLMEKISARIAVSEEARRTLVEHHGGDAVIIPNGVDTARFRDARPLPAWAGTPTRPVVAFLGRLDEPRKGLGVFMEAAPAVLARHPGARFLVAGRGEAQEAREAARVLGGAVEFLGPIDDERKQSLFAGASVYVAPQTGGESFGIVLVEAMAAGCPVVASDLEAFTALLQGGRVGRLFPTGDAAALAHAVNDLLAHEGARRSLGARGQRASLRYDWSNVVERILAVYQTVTLTTPRERRETGQRWRLGARLRRGED